ncbi:MAG: hypothetical protein ACTHL1_01460, partial [Burkholderiaceae bacterium]
MNPQRESGKFRRPGRFSDARSAWRMAVRGAGQRCGDACVAISSEGDMNLFLKSVEYDRPVPEGATCVAHAWARAPETVPADEKPALKERIRRLLQENEAALVAHYYVDPDLQDLAEETGGCV